MFGLGFLNAIFLFALGAIVLPVVIHILNRRRLRKIRFSSLDFIDELNKRRMSKINLRRWIVLLLRTLAVAFLVLAFARPTLRSNANLLVAGGAPKNVVICLDASYSMGAEREEGTVFTRAKDLAIQVVDECGENDIVNLIAFAARPTVLFETGTRNRQVVKTAIRRMEVTAEGTAIPAAIETALRLAGGPEAATKEIYVISDFREPADSVLAGPLPDNTRLILLPVYRDAIDNVSIDRVFTPRKLIRPGETVRIGVTVTNHSRERSADFPLELAIGGKRKAEKLVDLSPSSSATIAFVITMAEPGTYRGRVSKDRDRLPIDDDRGFVLDVSRQIPVTLVRGLKWQPGGKPDTPPSYFYVEKALNPRGSSEGEFSVDVVDQSALAIANLPDRGVVVWTDPEGADTRRLDLIERYVDGGGALMMFLGGSAGAAWREDRFRRYLGCERMTAKEKPDGARFVSFSDDRRIFGMFNEEELELLSQSRVTRYVGATGVPADSVLAYFDDGSPGVWECRRGKGRIVVVATSPDLTNGNLPLSPMFLPFLHAAVSYLSSAGGSDARVEYLVGKDLVFDLPPKWSVQTGDLRVRTDARDDIKPVFSETKDGQIEAIVSQPRDTGFYTLLADSTEITEACVNVDTRESNLNPRPLDRRTLGDARVVAATAHLARDIRRERQGREIYAVLFFLALAALAAEALIGRRA